MDLYTLLKRAARVFLVVLTSSLRVYSQCGGGPTSDIDSNLESFFLLGNTSQINYNGCPGDLGVEDQTS